jgi:hypothetical protein
VSELEAAAYMLRYIVIAICSGLVERVFWWRLVAFGYGLVDDSKPEWRKRPAFKALGLLLKRFEDSNFVGRTTVSGSALDEEGICYRFMRDNGQRWTMAYSANGSCQVALPDGVATVQDGLGESVDVVDKRVTPDMMPIYFDYAP